MYRAVKESEEDLSPGIAFRFSQDMSDRDEARRCVPWGQLVMGIDVDDGWLKTWVYADVANDPPDWYVDGEED